MANITRTQKNKKQKVESNIKHQTQDELLVPKDEPVDFKGIHVRGLTKHKYKKSIQKHDETIAQSKIKKLSKKGKNKPVVNYPSRSKTKETNELRLNSKYLFNPSIKK